MAETSDSPVPDPPTSGLPVRTLEDLQHWTWVMGRAQQLMMEHVALQMAEAPAKVAAAEPKAALGPWGSPALSGFTSGFPAFGPAFDDASKLVEAQTELWAQGLSIWQRALGLDQGESALKARADKDRRFAAPEWRDNPLFDMIRQSYLLVSDRLLGSVDAIEGIGEEQREQLRFATRLFVDAMSPSNFALTNPQVIERTIASRGENLQQFRAHLVGIGAIHRRGCVVEQVGLRIGTEQVALSGRHGRGRSITNRHAS